MFLIKKTQSEQCERTQTSKRSDLTTLKGFLFAALSAICYGTNPLGALHLYAQGYSPETVLFYRFFTAALLLLVVILAKGSPPFVSTKIQ